MLPTRPVDHRFPGTENRASSRILTMSDSPDEGFADDKVTDTKAAPCKGLWCFL